MFELSLNGVKKYMDANLILKNISFQVYEGEKVGIVGANGSGKSTILKLIAGILKLHCHPGNTSTLGYDEGIISIPRGATRAYLEQIPQDYAGYRVIDILNIAFTEVRSIETELRGLESKMKTLEGVALEKVLKQYSELTQVFEVKGGYEIEEKLSRVCKRLNFSESFLTKDFQLLSGGEKTTVGLGKILIENPDILLLDEPTNHLDMDSIEWLEDYLKSYKGIVIIVSHDRYFLDNVVSKIIEIEDMECETYKGNYSAFVKEKEERMLLQFEDFREQQKQIKAMEKSVRELRDWAQRSDNSKFFKRAASIQKKLEKMERIEKPMFERRNMRLSFKETERSGNETIKANELSKNYDEKVILKDADLLVYYGERAALIGANGSGKTTFLKMLLGEEQPDSGVVKLGANVEVGYLPQNITFKNEELTVVECFREDFFIMEGKAREYLSKFMFYGSSVFKKVKHLSGGERIRLKLSQLLYEDVNLLILDEPTNHLDINSIETFEAALEEFQGTIFFISHDRYLINKISDRLISLENMKFVNHAGNYDDYKAAKASSVVEAPILQQKSEKVIRVVDKKRQPDGAKLELRMEILENEIKELDLAMAVSGIEYEALNQLYFRKEELAKELNEVMEIWLEMNN
ncbi:ABC transporter ATP-binding protein [Anaerobacillus alkaliphilus]|uniref:ABC transporter ATP-binding protein n=1 Tax=Anaerobacillus alkaliphilus TaxID=1548597 RepID=A0A4Q0VMW3_9BACI|nr:ABC-F type ribosomal protection protein [Anaerobacillus alkaliphilus]RXI96170.1 ABC transporter ATP-binding protein [Anaerobacillus alkaliphilus]